MVVIGDAAHVTSPSSGQGASLAIEDALILAQCLRDCGGLSAAFAAYQQLRHHRVRRVLKVARQINNSKVAGPLGRSVRDHLFPIMLRWGSKAMQTPWLYNHHINFDHSIALASAK
jgi:2-polyprenyl-6-methoxyphenol hydroxylase-like FAD-dependent oxidoreductase